MISGAWASNSNMRRIREDMTSLVVDNNNNLVGWHLVFTFDSMASEGLGGGGSCRGRHDMSGRPYVVRTEGRHQMSELNLGGELIERKETWIKDRCGISLFHTVFNHIKNICKPLFKIAPGFDWFKKHKDTCIDLLTEGNRNSPNWKGETVEACKPLFKMFRPSKKWNRETKEYGNALGCPKKQGFCLFYCNKNDKICRDFFTTWSSAFFIIPPLVNPDDIAAAAVAAVVAAAAAAAAAANLVPEAAGAALTAEDLAVLEGSEGGGEGGGEGNREVADDGRDGGDVNDDHNADEHRLVTDTDTIFDGTTVIDVDVHGYVKVLPALTSLASMKEVLKHYLKKFPFLKGDNYSARSKAKQECVQDPVIRQQQLDAMEEVLNALPSATSKQRQEKKKLFHKIRNIQSNGILPGLYSIKKFIDECRLPQTKCIIPTGPGFDQLLTLLDAIINLDIVPKDNTDSEDRKVAFQMYDIINQKSNNALTLMNLNIKGRVEMAYTKSSNIIGELQFRSNVIGESCVVDSLHCGLRCIGTTMTTAWISDITIFDEKCTKAGKTRLDCLKAEVKSNCGTYVALEMNGKRLIIKKNGGNHFKGCLFNLDMSKCFRQEQEILLQNLEPQFCASEKETASAWLAVQKVARFIHWFNFESNNREADFGYNNELMESINNGRDAIDDDLTLKEIMRSELKGALHYFFDMMKKLRPITKLTTKRKKKDGSVIIAIKDYDFANTRSCRTLGVYMLELHDQCVNTADVNTNMGEQINGPIRLGKYLFFNCFIRSIYQLKLDIV